MKLTLGFSTCPNDTFIFDAMVHGRIDCEGLDFELILADVEELNKAAFAGNVDITKLSYHAFVYVAHRYKLLNSGSALGNNNGPLLVSSQAISVENIPHLRIAIPGKNTTANLLLSIAYPEAKNKTEYLFSDIEELVLSGKADAGLLIHENRFTYQARGLKKIADLGEFWQQTYNQPIPLGGIVVNRRLPLAVQQKIDRVLLRSVDYAFQNPLAGLDFIRQHAQEMDEEVMYKHIHLYVNNFTRQLGEVGKNAIRKLYSVAAEKNIIAEVQTDIFVEL